MLQKIVDELIRLRMAWGLTPDDLAELLGCAGGTVRKMESGFRTPSTRLLMKWADALGCDLTLERRL